jgi:hypothetical protein
MMKWWAVWETILYAPIKTPEKTGIQTGWLWVDRLVPAFATTWYHEAGEKAIMAGTKSCGMDNDRYICKEIVVFAKK